MAGAPAEPEPQHPDPAPAPNLAVVLDADDTTLSVATTSGPVWTTDPADLPMDIMVGGERMSVTAVSGASSPQTVTVTRWINGVVKPHLSGAAVRIAEPVVTAL